MASEKSTGTRFHVKTAHSVCSNSARTDPVRLRCAVSNVFQRRRRLRRRSGRSIGASFNWPRLSRPPVEGQGHRGRDGIASPAATKVQWPRTDAAACACAANCGRGADRSVRLAAHAGTQRQPPRSREDVRIGSRCFGPRCCGCSWFDGQHQRRSELRAVDEPYALAPTAKDADECARRDEPHPPPSTPPTPIRSARA